MLKIITDIIDFAIDHGLVKQLNLGVSVIIVIALSSLITPANTTEILLVSWLVSITWAALIYLRSKKKDNEQDYE